jgi:hypothetical protein
MRTPSPALGSLRTVLLIASMGLPAGARPEGWTRYVSRALSLSLEHPSDWTVKEDDSAITFVSPKGGAILLEVGGPAEPSPDEPEIPHRRCSFRTNAHGLTARVCLDTLSMTWYAVFLLESPGQKTTQLTLTTRGKGLTQFFHHMVDSLQLQR